MKKSLLALSVLALSSSANFAADYSDGNTHKGDYKWMQFNYMYSIDEMPREKGASENTHDYLEMEFGGRSGVFDLYGYVDVFNLSNRDNTDSSDSNKMYMKFAPRTSIDALTGIDMSFGPVQELYLATLFSWSGDGSVNSSFWGVGSDVMVPWLGKVGLNLYGLYDLNKKDWNGYQLSTNWFKPFFFFKNGSFISYQGYIDYQFGADKDANHVSSGGTMFNGIYWHSDRFAVGYGLKAYKDIYTLENDVAFGGLETTGFSHYLAATYKF